MQKLLTIAIPCYNSEKYMKRAINSVLPCRDNIEIIIVDDGSTDNTAVIAKKYVSKYPEDIRLVQKENGGHGDAVIAGLHNATGQYFRVLDSDDWLDKKALVELLEVLRDMIGKEDAADLVISNYVYEKVKERKSHAINYTEALPVGRIFTWDEFGKFKLGSYILMHSTTYRTKLLLDCKLSLPKHTFYVDHLYVCLPMMSVEKMYYLNADLYHYYIGREGQSVNEDVMIKNIKQQIKVNRLMLYQFDTDSIENDNKREYLYSYTEIVTLATVAFLLRTGSKKDEKRLEILADEIEKKRPIYYKWLTTFPHPLGLIRKYPRWFGYTVSRLEYLIMRRIFKFN